MGHGGPLGHRSGKVEACARSSDQALASWLAVHTFSRR